MRDREDDFFIFYICKILQAKFDSPSSVRLSRISDDDFSFDNNKLHTFYIVVLANNLFILSPKGKSSEELQVACLNSFFWKWEDGSVIM